MAMTKDKLIRALLPHAPFDGWGEKALAAAARDCGLTPLEAGVHLSKEAARQIDAWLELTDQELETALAARGLANMKIRERIASAVRLRLELAEPYREAVRRAATVLAMPQNLPLALKSTWRTADIIWRAAGDTATDFNHYSKRTILGGVYSACLLYWLQDESDGRADTWAFLDRRIAGILRFEKAKAGFNRRTEHMPSLTRFLSRLRYPAR
jgi:ubiquinone biosynthesis protein COQ9